MFICREPGYYPHKSDCTKFYQCDGYAAHLIQCTTGLVFNIKREICDWPSNVPECLENDRISPPNSNSRNPERKDFEKGNVNTQAPSKTGLNQEDRDEYQNRQFPELISRSQMDRKINNENKQREPNGNPGDDKMNSQPEPVKAIKSGKHLYFSD